MSAVKNDFLRTLQKIDELASIAIPAESHKLAGAIGGIRYWVISQLGEQSRCAQQCKRERAKDVPLAAELAVDLEGTP